MVKVLSRIYLGANISKTVRDRCSVPKDDKYEMAYRAAQQNLKAAFLSYRGFCRRGFCCGGYVVHSYVQVPGASSAAGAQDLHRAENEQKIPQVRLQD